MRVVPVDERFFQGMEPMIGLMIRDLPADVITLKLGINMHGGSTSPRTYAAGAIGLVRIIREKHPDIPIALISPIISPPRETTPGATGLTLGRVGIRIARMKTGFTTTR